MGWGSRWLAAGEGPVLDEDGQPVNLALNASRRADRAINELTGVAAIIDRVGIVLLALTITAVDCGKPQPRQPQIQQPTATEKASSGLRVNKISAGSIVTPLRFGIKLNAGSTLKRTAYVINDDSAPASLSSAFIRTVFESKEYSGEYKFIETGQISFSRPVKAYWIGYSLFDVWGQRLKALASEEIRDFTSGRPVKISGEWPASEHEVATYLTCFSFIRKVRLEDGRIWSADLEALQTEIAKVIPELQPEWLRPEQSKTEAPPRP